MPFTRKTFIIDAIPAPTLPLRKPPRSVLGAVKKDEAIFRRRIDRFPLAAHAHFLLKAERAQFEFAGSLRCGTEGVGPVRQDAELGLLPE